MKYLKSYKLFESIISEETDRYIRDAWMFVDDQLHYYTGKPTINKYSDHIDISLNIPNDGIKGHSDSLDFISSHYLYYDILSAHEMTLKLLDIKKFEVSIDSVYNKKSMNVRIYYPIHEDKYFDFKRQIDKPKSQFILDNFDISGSYIYKKLDKIGIIIATQNPVPLPEGHPDNKNNNKFFTMAKEIYVFDENWYLITELHIDERFSIFEVQKGISTGIRKPNSHNATNHNEICEDIQNWIIDEYGKILNELIEENKDKSFWEKKDLNIHAQDLILRLYKDQSNFKGEIPEERITMNKYETFR